MKEATRDRKARGGRRPSAREGRSPGCSCATADASREPIPANACRSMPARRAKEVSVGTNRTSSEGGRPRPRNQQRHHWSTVASSFDYGGPDGYVSPPPRLREASVVRRGSPPVSPRSMRRGRGAREWVAMAYGHRARRPREDEPKARLTGANEGTTRHAGAQPVANSGAHSVAAPSSGGASALVRAAQPRYGVAG